MKVLEALKGLGPARLAAMGGVALATLGLLAFLAMQGGQPMALLYADLDLKEAGQITDQLDHAHIPHQDLGQGSRIMVPADQVARARLLLAKEGLPSGGSIGYEIFDRGDALTASQFQQNINETRALEGELARSIRMINGVRGVRVHLVLPQREPFAREKPEAQASVLLTMAGAGADGQAKACRPSSTSWPRLCPGSSRRTSPSSTTAATCWPAPARRPARPRRRRARRRSAARPSSGFPARSRRCWSARWARAACAPRPRSR